MHEPRRVQCRWHVFLDDALVWPASNHAIPAPGTHPAVHGTHAIEIRRIAGLKGDEKPFGNMAVVNGQYTSNVKSIWADRTFDLAVISICRSSVIAGKRH
jgi:hypothetical protein